MNNCNREHGDLPISYTMFYIKFKHKFGQNQNEEEENDSYVVLVNQDGEIEENSDEDINYDSDYDEATDEDEDEITVNHSCFGTEDTVDKEKKFFEELDSIMTNIKDMVKDFILKQLSTRNYNSNYNLERELVKRLNLNFRVKVYSCESKRTEHLFKYNEGWLIEQQPTQTKYEIDLSHQNKDKDESIPPKPLPFNPLMRTINELNKIKRLKPLPAMKT